jgi:XTP/dITP diphosphohydrolase
MGRRYGSAGKNRVKASSPAFPAVERGAFRKKARAEAADFKKNGEGNADMPKIVLATRNAGKIRELADALRAFGLEALGLDRFPAATEVEESGASFEENALLKARAAALHSGLVAVADDSGLEVDALNGAPGVCSARFAAMRPTPPDADPADDRDMRNNRALLADLAAVPEAGRTARFVCAMCACKPDGRSVVVRGRWEGRILRAPRGANGFGYDPLFFDVELKRSAAELAPEEKNARSHRGGALRKLLAIWPEFYGS